MGNGINSLLMISFYCDQEEMNRNFYNKFMFMVLKGFRINGIHFTFCSPIYDINDNDNDNHNDNDNQLNHGYDVWLKYNEEQEQEQKEEEEKEEEEVEEEKAILLFEKEEETAGKPESDDYILMKEIVKLKNKMFLKYRFGFVMGCIDYISFIKTKKEFQDKNIDNKLLKDIVYENTKETKWFDNDINERIKQYHNINFKRWNPPNCYSVSTNINNVLYHYHDNDKNDDNDDKKQNILIRNVVGNKIQVKNNNDNEIMMNKKGKKRKRKRRRNRNKKNKNDV